MYINSDFVLFSFTLQLVIYLFIILFSSLMYDFSFRLTHGALSLDLMVFIYYFIIITSLKNYLVVYKIASHLKTKFQSLP